MSDNTSAPDDRTDDLPPDTVRMLRDLTPADTALREAHIAAALAEIASPGVGSIPVTDGNVVRMDFRRRTLLTVAAATFMVLSAGIGWSVRGGDRNDVLAVSGADTSVGSAGNTPAASSPAKGAVTSAPGAACTIQVFDSQYIGEYVNPADGRKYAVYTFDGKLEFIDRATCKGAELVGVSPQSIATTTTTP